MNAENAEPKAPVDRLVMPSTLPSGSAPATLPIYCERTIGELLRKLNLVCVKSVELGNHRFAQEVAELSSQIEYAMDLVDIK